MGILQGNDQFVYNGYTFPGGVKTRLEVTPVLDAAERTVVYSIVKIMADWVVVSATPSAHESVISDMRNRLSKAGADYTYSSHGVGPVATGLNLKDVKWGPRPGPLELDPLGPQACQCSWSLEIAYPQCTDARGAGYPMAYNYSVNYSIDDAGYTTRRISGYLEVPLTRIGGSRRLLYTADQFLESVVPAEIPGFHRRVKDRTVSPDKRRLDFNFVDEEQKTSPPANIIDQDGDYRIGSFPKMLTKYTATLNMNYRLGKNTPRQFAAEAFFELMKSKITNQGNEPILLTSFSCNEGLGSNSDRVSFNAQWIFVSSLTNCLRDGNVFKPVPNSSWFTWRSSVWNEAAMGPRGTAGLALKPTDDAIIDLCAGINGTPPSGSALVRNRPSLNRPTRIKTRITEEESWIDYECEIQLLEQNNQVPMQPLREETSQVSNANNSGTNPSNLLPPNGRTAGKLLASVAEKLIIQERSKPVYYVALVGHAMRAKFEILPPQLISVGGAEARQMKKQFKQKRVAKWSEEIFLAVWRIVYVLEEPPTKAKLITPGNPAFETGFNAARGVS